jgi:hypothetical protein
MPDHEEVRDWLLKTVQLVADIPDEVVVEAVPGDQRRYCGEMA